MTTSRHLASVAHAGLCAASGAPADGSAPDVDAVVLRSARASGAALVSRLVTLAASRWPHRVGGGGDGDADGDGEGAGGGEDVGEARRLRPAPPSAEPSTSSSARIKVCWRLTTANKTVDGAYPASLGDDARLRPDPDAVIALAFAASSDQMSR